MISNFFESFGMMEIVPEYMMNAVVCISSSAPAYIYMFIEALADAGVKYGMPRDVAYRMAAQGVVGSAKMVLETGKHPGALKDDVCSPGGTTIYAQENEAAEETEFFERIFREAALKKGRGTRQAAKEGGLWRNIRRRWERFMGGFPWQWK